jgi:hypothetical protein
MLGNIGIMMMSFVIVSEIYRFTNGILSRAYRDKLAPRKIRVKILKGTGACPEKCPDREYLLSTDNIPKWSAIGVVSNGALKFSARRIIDLIVLSIVIIL